MDLAKHVGAWKVIGGKKGCDGTIVVQIDGGRSTETPNMLEALKTIDEYAGVVMGGGGTTRRQRERNDGTCSMSTMLTASAWVPCVSVEE